MTELRDPCTVCYQQNTSTVVAFGGSLEWVVVGLMRLGLPQKEAIALVEMFGDDNDVNRYLVCQACAEKAGFITAEAGGPYQVYFEPPWVGAESHLQQGNPD